MFDKGTSYKFTMKSIVEKNTAEYIYGAVIEYQHPTVKIRSPDGKELIINTASSQFVCAEKSR